MRLQTGADRIVVDKSARRLELMAGDAVMHGYDIWWLLPGQPPGDWTRCRIAVADAEIEESTPIEIRP